MSAPGEDLLLDRERKRNTRWPLLILWNTAAVLYQYMCTLQKKNTYVGPLWVLQSYSMDAEKIAVELTASSRKRLTHAVCGTKEPTITIGWLSLMRNRGYYRLYR